MSRIFWMRVISIAIASALAFVFCVMLVVSLPLMKWAIPVWKFYIVGGVIALTLMGAGVFFLLLSRKGS